MRRPHLSLQALLPASAAASTHRLHGAVASRALERQARATLPPHALMARAGLAVARLALCAWPGARSVQVFAGPGNNGGDALVAATWLHRQGLHVTTTLLGDAAHLPDDARWALQQCTDLGLVIDRSLPPTVQADIVLDGLLGLGASRPPEGSLAEAIRLISTAASRVLAIDLPSGLNGDLGTVLGGGAVQAAHTLSLLTLKPGLFTAMGRDHAGRVWLDRLGVAPSASDCHLTGGMGSDAPLHSAHKGTFGDVVLLGGAQGMAGAALLAGRAALTAGAGRVFLGLLTPGAPSVDAARPELMHRPVDELLAPGRLNDAVVVCGCGGGEPVAALLPAVLAHARKLVLDADALNALASDPALRLRLAARCHHGRETILTPHPLEAARLLGCSTTHVQCDRFDAARSLASALGCTVVLKGSGTLIARPDGHMAVNPTGNARLACAGTGDVLAGWMGGLWARQGQAEDQAASVAEAAVFQHGLAADEAAGHAPMRAGDLIEAMSVTGFSGRPLREPPLPFA